MTAGRARVSGERFEEADSREDAKTAKNFNMIYFSPARIPLIRVFCTGSVVIASAFR